MAPVESTDAQVELGEYPPGLFAAVHTGVAGDIDFYRRVCIGAENVLELGIGSGRVAQRLHEDGLRVVGVDSNADFLASGVGKGIEVHLGDARSFRIDERFDRVIVPFNGVYCMLSEADVIDLLKTAAAHLKKEGLLIFDVYAADHFHEAILDEGEPEGDFELVRSAVEWKKRSYDVFERSNWDARHQRIDATYLHVPAEDGDAILASICHRYLLSEQIPQLLEQAGLELLVMHGGFDQHVFDDESELMIVTAQLK